MKSVTGNYVDILNKQIYPAEIFFNTGGNIVSIHKLSDNFKTRGFILPGFVDSHVHIESSMLTPAAFSDIVVPRGTVATVSDPHEIANVVGIKGVKSMQKWAKKADCKINFTIPSCVPSTSFDGSGAVLTSENIRILADSGKYKGLSEVMDVNSVVMEIPEMLKKIQAAKDNGMVVDGHAPLLSGKDLEKYIKAGVQTDHECSAIEEAREKISKGMTIQIREGSAAKNYQMLKPLIAETPDSLMFCTDDSHPDKIIDQGGIDYIVRTALEDGYDLFDVLKIACVNPVLFYKLDVGLLREGDPADFIIVDDLKKFKVRFVYINGRKVFVSTQKKDVPAIYPLNKNGKYLNNFKRPVLAPEELINPMAKGKYSAIKMIPGELITEELEFSIEKDLSNFESDTERDILKIVYINRYSEKSVPQIQYINGMGLKNGAIASSVSHDSHNIIAVGTNDSDLLKAINSVIDSKGGIACVSKGKKQFLPLPVAGILSDWNGYRVKRKFMALKKMAVESGATVPDPYMALSFMALIVIPFFKIGENGLFDYKTFSFRS